LDIFYRFFIAAWASSFLQNTACFFGEEAIDKDTKLSGGLGSAFKKLRHKTKHSQSSKRTTTPVDARLRLIGILVKYHFIIIIY